MESYDRNISCQERRGSLLSSRTPDKAGGGPDIVSEFSSIPLWGAENNYTQGPEKSTLGARLSQVGKAITGAITGGHGYHETHHCGQFIPETGQL